MISRLLVLAVFCLANAGCDRLKELSGGSGAGSSAPEPARPSGSAADFSGTYTSNWGTTTFAQQGGQVTAGYPNGTMTCTASGNLLDCDWREAAASGKAKLGKLPNGNIEGTWGNGKSATDGGLWSFVLASAPAKTTGPLAEFAGSYDSNWGPTTFEQQGSNVTARWQKGSMTCVAAGNTVDCDWKEATNSGKAKLTKLPNGNISGTWGNGKSATDGGPWLFTKK